MGAEVFEVQWDDQEPRLLVVGGIYGLKTKLMHDKMERGERFLILGRHSRTQVRVRLERNGRVIDVLHASHVGDWLDGERVGSTANQLMELETAQALIEELEHDRHE